VISSPERKKKEKGKTAHPAVISNAERKKKEEGKRREKRGALHLHLESVNL